MAHELIADRCRRRIDVAVVAVLAAWAARRRMALSKRAWLERAVIFGRVCAAQRRRSRHFHAIGVVALDLEACMWDPDRTGIVSSIGISLWVAIEISRCFVLFCLVLCEAESSVSSRWRSENTSR